jgi:RNA polymerase sigma-70 factor (ECF subfamily)
LDIAVDAHSRNLSDLLGLNFPAEAALQHGDDDRRLMQAFCDGDDSRFDVLFRRWSGRVLRFLERMIPEPAVAEDLLQETFLRVHRARGRWEPSARFSTWLFTIATNLALNELRRPYRRSVHESADVESQGAHRELVAEAPAVDEVAHARRLGDEVDRALESLPERQRAALWLTAVEGLSYAEVAASLGASPQSVKALVHRGRSTLAEQLPHAIDRGEEG